MSRKTIVISEDGMFASEPLSFADVLQLTCSCVAGVAGSVLAKTESAEEREKIEAELFDIANLSFSNCLAHAFPTQELRPDLTEEAILKAENDILKDRAKEMEDFLADSEPQVGEPEKIVPFPTSAHVRERAIKACNEGECDNCTGSNPEPAGTYDPNEGCRPVEGDAE